MASISSSISIIKGTVSGNFSFAEFLAVLAVRFVGCVRMLLVISEMKDHGKLP